MKIDMWKSWETICTFLSKEKILLLSIVLKDVICRASATTACGSQATTSRAKYFVASS